MRQELLNIAYLKYLNRLKKETMWMHERTEQEDGRYTNKTKMMKRLSLLSTKQIRKLYELRVEEYYSQLLRLIR